MRIEEYGFFWYSGTKFIVRTRMLPSPRQSHRPLGSLQRLLVKAVLENTVDQLAIVSGTLQHVLTLPHNQLHGPIHAAQEVIHWNRSDKPLEELLLREHREKQKIVRVYFLYWSIKTTVT